MSSPAYNSFLTIPPGDSNFCQDATRRIPIQYFNQHVDLLNIFYDLAFRKGVEIRHNANVVHTDLVCATIRLDTGETLSGDVIILADGLPVYYGLM